MKSSVIVLIVGVAAFAVAIAAKDSRALNDRPDHGVAEQNDLSQKQSRYVSTPLALPVDAPQPEEILLAQAQSEPSTPPSPPVTAKSPSDRAAPSSSQPVNNTPNTVAPVAVGNNNQQPDESALRYFASQKDTKRLEAEISRLKALYPNWTPPKDPLAVPVNSDKQLDKFWQLYAQGRYAELRKAITDRQAAEPGWQPPADLLDLLAVGEARTRLINASDLNQYDAVINIAAQTPRLLTCSEVDILWRVAESFAKTGKTLRARDAYSYILDNCTNSAERLATIQKASVLLDYPIVKDLLAKEKTDASGAPEFDSVRDDLARRFVADAQNNPKLDVAPEYIARLENLAQKQGLPSDELLLGWYYLRRNKVDEAEKWFRAARQQEDSASASQGLALVLLDKKSPQEAENVMYPWRNDSEDATSTYLAATANLMALIPPPDLNEEILQRIAKEVVEHKDAATAQQFGWYARALNQPETAERWFETTLRWKPDDEPSAYGLVITRNQLNDRKGVAELQRIWAGRSERIAKLGEPDTGNDQMQPEQTLRTIQSPRAPVERSVEQQRAPRVNRSVVSEPPPRRMTRATAQDTKSCTTTINPSLLEPISALTRGWCLMELNRPMEAAGAFEVALNSPERKIREDAAYGQSLAYLRVGMSAKAAVSATKAPQNAQRAAELQVSILADRALAAFEAKRYRETLIYLDQRAQIQQERTDLMVLRGYCYLNLKLYEDATRIFEALASTGNRDGLRGLADVRNARYPESRS